MDDDDNNDDNDNNNFYDNNMKKIGGYPYVKSTGSSTQKPPGPKCYC